MLVFGFLLLAGMVGAAVLHELTHAAAVVAVGGRVCQVSFRRLDVYWALEDDDPLWKDRVIGLAPLAIGGVVGTCALLLDAVPQGESGIILAAAWGIYTLFGGLDDYRTWGQSA